MTESLSDKIAGILNAAPISFDPEDEEDDTTARVVSNIETEEYEEEVASSSFRKQTAALLEETDERYKGVSTSRQKLNTNDWEDSDLESHDSDVQESQSESEENDDDDEVEDSTNEPNQDDNLSEEENAETTQNFKNFGDADTADEIKKGMRVRQQLKMWENLLEIRIEMQKVLSLANKLPPVQELKELQTKEQGLASVLADTKANACGLLDKFLNLQKVSVNNYPETKNLLSSRKLSVQNENDEEIASSTDNEDDEEDVEEIQSKRMKLNDYSVEIARRHEIYKNYRNSVIQKWDAKTRLTANKGNNTFHSVIDQIEHILSDKQKLIKRSQLVEDDRYDVNVFNDTNFYHHLLRELIERKSADLTDPVQLGRQFIQLQNLRSKMKRKIDTKATKGRKIRYAVHSKLVNFMAPIDLGTWKDEAKTELYNSLFGKNQP